jgi:hypothetical protein
MSNREFTLMHREKRKVFGESHGITPWGKDFVKGRSEP